MQTKYNCNIFTLEISKRKKKKKLLFLPLHFSPKRENRRSNRTELKREDRFSFSLSPRPKIHFTAAVVTVVPPIRRIPVVPDAINLITSFRGGGRWMQPFPIQSFPLWLARYLIVRGVCTRRLVGTIATARAISSLFIRTRGLTTRRWRHVF